MLKALVLLAIVAVTSVSAEIYSSQAESCRNAAFKLASEIDKGWRSDGTFKDPFPMKVVNGISHPDGELTSFGHFENVEWDSSVPLEKWSLSEGTSAKRKPFPLGFRRNVMQPNKGGVMCLKIPSTMRNHKIEVMVESSTKQNLCISDTRRSAFNHRGNKIMSECDPKGQIISCYSGITNPNTGVPALADEEQPVAIPVTQDDPNTGYSLVIGCSGQSCGESDYTLFYRVRSSAVTWTTDLSGEEAESNGSDNALNSLNIWCMVMENRDPVLGLTDTTDPNGQSWANAYAARKSASQTLKEITMPDGTVVTATYTKSLDEQLKMENMFPQYFPSDMWAPVWTAAKEQERLEKEEACLRSLTGCDQRALTDDEKYNPYKMGAANAVAPTFVVVALAALALLF